MRTQVAIIGGGPSGMLLGQLLHRNGIESIVLERRDRAHVLARIRAGVLERGLIGLMEAAGVADRLHREGFVHDGTNISFDNAMFRLDLAALAGKPVVVYGQTEVTRDLYDARAAAGLPLIDNAEGVAIHDATTDRPSVTYTRHGAEHRIDCDFIAGCDGFHGVSRRTIPGHVRQSFEKVYPFGWLGILSQTPPVSHELIYAGSDAGFALCSMRNANLSRYYVQCAAMDRVEDWPDARFWDELRRRLPEEVAQALITGPSIEKSIAPLRSFVTEPMRWGRLFLVGDAAHIVPPTGAKGLNTAASDVHYLWQGLVDHYHDADPQGLDQYSARALLRVWKAERFSWSLTTLLHRFPDQTGFDRRMQAAEIAFLRDNHAAQVAFAQNYVGLPY